MPNVPVNIVNVTAAAGVTNKLVTGNIKGDIGASVNISANACHGIELGIGAKAEALVNANAGSRLLVGECEGKQRRGGRKSRCSHGAQPFDRWITVKEGLMLSGRRR